jgi:hypothetical protein
LEGKDKISDKYREEVEKLLGDKYSFDPSVPLSREEQDEIWEEISDQLDIDAVWRSILSDLDSIMPAENSSGILIKSVAAIFIILIGLIPVKKTSLISGSDFAANSIETGLDDQAEQEETEDKTLNYYAEEPLGGDISPEMKNFSDKSGLSVMDDHEESSVTGILHITATNVSKEQVSDALVVGSVDDHRLIVSQSEIPSEKSCIPPALFYDNLKNKNLFMGTDVNNLKANEGLTEYGLSLPANETARFSAGFVTLLRNTWLLNDETFRGLKSESLNTTEMVFFPDIALSLNYSLNRTWSFQADGFLCSNTGQDYLDYIYGHYSRKSITLRYSTIALSVKYRITNGRIPAERSSVNFLAGAYMSFLHQAQQKINADLENIRPQYLNHDFGVRAGGEFEFYLTDRLSLAPGLFISLGIPNIYRGDSYIPGFLRRTHNGSASFQLTFYYH